MDNATDRLQRRIVEIVTECGGDCDSEAAYYIAKNLGADWDRFIDMAAAVREADEAVSAMHDFFVDIKPDGLSAFHAAAWRAHNALRPLLAAVPQKCAVCGKPPRNVHYCQDCRAPVCLVCGEGHECKAVGPTGGHE